MKESYKYTGPTLLACLCTLCIQNGKLKSLSNALLVGIIVMQSSISLVSTQCTTADESCPPSSIYSTKSECTTTILLCNFFLSAIETQNILNDLLAGHRKPSRVTSIGQTPRRGSRHTSRYIVCGGASDIWLQKEEV